MNCAGIFRVPSEDLPVHRLLLVTEDWKGPLSPVDAWRCRPLEPQKGNTKTHAKGLRVDASMDGWGS